MCGFSTFKHIIQQLIRAHLEKALDVKNSAVGSFCISTLEFGPSGVQTCAEVFSPDSFGVLIG